MRISRRFTLIAALIAVSGMAKAGDVQPVDEDFLEFLGTLDTEDEGLADFLASDESLEHGPVETAPVKDEAKEPAKDEPKAATAKKVNPDEK